MHYTLLCTPLLIILCVNTLPASNKPEHYYYDTYPALRYFGVGRLDTAKPELRSSILTDIGSKIAHEGEKGFSFMTDPKARSAAIDTLSTAQKKFKELSKEFKPQKTKRGKAKKPAYALKMAVAKK